MKWAFDDWKTQSDVEITIKDYEVSKLIII